MCDSKAKVFLKKGTNQVLCSNFQQLCSWYSAKITNRLTQKYQQFKLGKHCTTLSLS